MARKKTAVSPRNKYLKASESRIDATSIGKQMKEEGTRTHSAGNEESNGGFADGHVRRFRRN